MIFGVSVTCTFVFLSSDFISFFLGGGIWLNLLSILLTFSELTVTTSTDVLDSLFDGQISALIFILAFYFHLLTFIFAFASFFLVQIRIYKLEFFLFSELDLYYYNLSQYFTYFIHLARIVTFICICFPGIFFLFISSLTQNLVVFYLLQVLVSSISIACQFHASMILKRYFD